MGVHVHIATVSQGKGGYHLEVFEWVHWYNNPRLHSALGHQTPEEFEQAYHARKIGSLPDDAANKKAA